MNTHQWTCEWLPGIAGGLLLAATLGYWSVVLLNPGRPQAAITPPQPAPAAPANGDAATPLVRLMSPGAVQTDVSVLGVMAGERTPLALLSVNGNAAAYAPGERLGPATVLASITADGVQLQQAGQLRMLALPLPAALPEGSIVPVATGQH